MTRSLTAFCSSLVVAWLVGCGAPAAESPAEEAPSAQPPATAPSEAASVSGATPSGLHYDARGAGDAVVLVHAFSLDRRMWDEQVEVLEDRYRVVRFDQRGHGRSGAPEQAYAAHTDLLEIFDALGLESASLVGLSSGAEASLDFAIAFPERVDRLFLASPGLSGYVPEGSFDWMSGVMSALQAGDAEEAMRRWVETPLMRVADAGANARIAEIGNSNWRLWTYSPELRRMFDPPAVGRLDEVDAPTLVIVGALDLADTLRVGELLTAGIEGAEKITIEDAGHMVNLAAPGVFNEAMHGFLAEEGG